MDKRQRGDKHTVVLVSVRSNYKAWRTGRLTPVPPAEDVPTRRTQSHGSCCEYGTQRSTTLRGTPSQQLPQQQLPTYLDARDGPVCVAAQPLPLGRQVCDHKPQLSQHVENVSKLVWLQGDGPTGTRNLCWMGIDCCWLWFVVAETGSSRGTDRWQMLNTLRRLRLKTRPT